MTSIHHQQIIWHFMVPPMPSVENLLKIVGGKDAKSSKKHHLGVRAKTKSDHVLQQSKAGELQMSPLSAEKRKDVRLSRVTIFAYWCRIACIGIQLGSPNNPSFQNPVLLQLSEKVASKAPSTPLVTLKVWGQNLEKISTELIESREGDDTVLCWIALIKFVKKNNVLDLRTVAVNKMKCWFPTKQMALTMTK